MEAQTHKRVYTRSAMSQRWPAADVVKGLHSRYLAKWQTLRYGQSWSGSVLAEGIEEPDAKLVMARGRLQGLQH